MMKRIFFIALFYLKRVVSVMLYVIAIYLVGYFYPWWVFVPILAFLVLAIVFGLVSIYRGWNEDNTKLALALIILDLLVTLVLAVIAVYFLFGWLQGVLATLIVVAGVGHNVYIFLGNRRSGNTK